MKLLTLPFRLAVVLLKLIVLTVVLVGLPFIAIPTVLILLGSGSHG